LAITDTDADALPASRRILTICSAENQPAGQ
jgi:hypothetical protein